MMEQEKLLMPMLSRRQLLKMAGGTLTVGLLSACASPTAPSAGTGGDSGSAAPAAGMTVTFWRMPYATTASPMAKEELDKFYGEQMPAMLPDNISVETVEVADAPFDKIQASLAAGQPPDITIVDQTWVSPLLALSAINAMPDGLIDVVGSFGSFTNDFFRVGEEGTIYILPWGWWERGVFYNLGLLSEHGYAPEDLPNNLADLIPFAQELTVWPEGAAEPTLTAWPLAGGTTFDFYTALVDNLGGFWWLNDSASGFGEPEWEEAWRMTLAMFDTFHLDAREGLDAIERFYGGKSYFLPQQLWVGNVLRRDYPDLEWGVMTHPTPNGKAPYGWQEAHTGWGNLSTKSGADLDATWEVWKVLYSPEWTRANALALNYIPARLEAQNQEPFVAENQQWAGAIVKHNVGNSVCPGFWPADMWKIINTAWEQVYLTNADVAETLQGAKREADALLAVSPEIQATIITKQDYVDHPDWTEGKIPIAAWWDGTYGSYLTAEQQAELG